MTDDEVEAIRAQSTAELRAAFDLFDTDHDGRIGAHELSAALVELGQDVGLSEAASLIASVDPHRTGSVGFHEFTQLIEPTPHGLDTEADDREVFAVLDRDGDGYLSAQELARAGEDAGVTVDGAAVVRASDTDGDGRLSFAEFRRAMRR